jgi:hypothetical protein
MGMERGEQSVIAGTSKTLISLTKVVTCMLIFSAVLDTKQITLEICEAMAQSAYTHIGYVASRGCQQ